ncbi:hypothetical protein D3C85_1754030 [compost metagenome]
MTLSWRGGMDHQVAMPFPEVFLYLNTDAPGCPGNIITDGQNVSMLINDGYAGGNSFWARGLEAGTDCRTQSCAV